MFCRWYVTLSSTSLSHFCWIQLAALQGCVYCIISHFVTYTDVSHLFHTCRRWLYIIWLIICSIIEMYFVLAQFVCSHLQLCLFPFWFIVMLCVCHKLVSYIHQDHRYVPLMSDHCDYFVLNSPGGGMLFSYTIHFLMKVGCLHHHTRSESSYHTCYSRLIGCSPSQHLPKVGGDCSDLLQLVSASWC